MKEFSNYSNLDHYQLFLSGKLGEHERIYLVFLRGENIYDEDVEPEATALESLTEIFSRAGLKVFFLWASEDLGRSSLFRTKKFNLSSKAIFEGYKSLIQENFASEEDSRLVCTVELDKYSEIGLPNESLNWARGIFVLSQFESEEYIKLINWPISTHYSSSAYNVKEILNLINSKNDFCIVRYFPAENRRPEALAVIGNTGSKALNKVVAAVSTL